ncbi:hypothetical protein CRUP_035871 [Coryphaenoides rupestris]|nr:hypothetical protein CRUP_035871 [Coryphaenoides rupestris]
MPGNSNCFINAAALKAVKGRAGRQVHLAVISGKNVYIIPARWGIAAHHRLHYTTTTACYGDGVMPSSPTIAGGSSSSSSLLPFSSFPSSTKQKSAFAPVLRPQGSPSPACPASGGVGGFRGSHPTHYLTPLSELTNAV